MPIHTSVLAGFDGWHIATRHGSAFVARHGAQLLSWTPDGEADILWLSPQASPLPTPIRGGVPLCWPWFARQGVASTAAQHGPVRSAGWEISEVSLDTDEEVRLSFMPLSRGFIDLDSSIDVSVTMTLWVGQSLRQTLHTRNSGKGVFTLTQALHSYFAVADATQIEFAGVDGLHYRDKLLGGAQQHQVLPFVALPPCDRVYEGANGRYRLRDPIRRRDILIESDGSASVVVWNPGAQAGEQMTDVGANNWRNFFCVEVANAGSDVITLAPQSTHALSQTVRWQRNAT